MKLRMYIYYRILFIAIFVLFVTSCTKNESEIQQNSSDNQENVENTLNGATKEWGMPREEIISFMKGYVQVSGTGNDMLQFKNPKSNQYISYALQNDRLCATVIIVDASAYPDLQAFLSECTYLGDLSNSSVYVNRTGNTMAAVWQFCDHEKNFPLLVLHRLFRMLMIRFNLSQLLPTNLHQWICLLLHSPARYPV